MCNKGSKINIDDADNWRTRGLSPSCVFFTFSDVQFKGPVTRLSSGLSSPWSIPFLRLLSEIFFSLLLSVGGARGFILSLFLIHILPLEWFHGFTCHRFFNVHLQVWTFPRAPDVAAFLTWPFGYHLYLVTVNFLHRTSCPQETASLVSVENIHLWCIFLSLIFLSFIFISFAFKQQILLVLPSECVLHRTNFSTTLVWIIFILAWSNHKTVS